MKFDTSLWSNLFFLIPLGLSIYFEVIIHSIIIFFVLIISTYYHYTKYETSAKYDKIFAYLLVSYNLYLCYESNFKFPYFHIALIFVFVGLHYLWIKKKDDWQWHLSSAIITSLCSIAYASVIFN